MSAGLSLCAYCSLLHCVTVVIVSWRKHHNIYFLPSYTKQGKLFWFLCHKQEENTHVISFHLKWLIALKVNAALRMNFPTYSTWVVTVETKSLVAALALCLTLNYTYTVSTYTACGMSSGTRSFKIKYFSLTCTPVR